VGFGFFVSHAESLDFGGKSATFTLGKVFAYVSAAAFRVAQL
jgi:hypothetical protein